MAPSNLVSYQEDTYSVHSLLIPNAALKSNVWDKKEAAGWTPDLMEPEGYEGESKEDKKRQVAFFGVFDGHGGSQVSKYLKQNLHSLIEETNVSQIPKVIDSYRSLGGYLKRYRGGPLERFRNDESGESERRGMGIGLDEMSVLAFLQADVNVLEDPSTKQAGSVGTVALLHSLDTPHTLPFTFSPLLSLTISHLGDTRALLSSTSGRPVPLTETHHADSRIESERLRTLGTGIVTDSFGESRWGGTLANTRGIGDGEFKPLGVIGEPETNTRVLKGSEWSFLVMFSDGVSDVMSDQEVVDLCRGEKDPTRAAGKIVNFAEQVGAEDNLTVIVVPLPGWGKMTGMDVSASRREYRMKQQSSQSLRQKRM